MSLRRPRIRSAVNLAALANGRRKEKPPEEVPKPPEPEIEPETTSHMVENPVADEQTNSVISNGQTEPGKVVANENEERVEAADESNITNVLNGDIERETNETEKSGICESSSEIRSDPSKDLKSETRSDPSKDLSSDIPSDLSKESSSEIRSDPSKDSSSEIRSDPKTIENPFSPPPARPAPPMGRFKSRFRPNLNENRNRIRRFSGTISDLVRITINFFLNFSNVKKLNKLNEN